MKRTHFALSVVLIVLSTSCLIKPTQTNARSKETVSKKQIQLSITHPGFKSTEAQNHDLTMLVNSTGNPISYHMDVRSVFCSDDKCDVITLTMEWDALGRYQSYKMAMGDALTKYDHEPFEDEDYKRFGALMNNRGSVLSDLETHHIIVKKKDPNGKKPGTKESPVGVAGKADVLQKVDAISGATATYVKEEVVEGAAYTCYTMWHWANGNTSRKIRQHSQNTATEDWLSSLLLSDDEDYVGFALEGITRRELFTAETKGKAVNAALACSDQDYKQLIAYLEKASANTEDLFNDFEGLLRTASSKRRVTLLERIINHHQDSPADFHNKVSTYLTTFETFYEVQLYLAIVDKHQPGSEKVYDGVSVLLKNDNFFIARRAHEFLKSKDLTDDITQKMAQFEKKHKARLRL